MSLERSDVQHVARLARLGLTEDEVVRLQAQLTQILDQFAALQALDTTDVPATAQVGGIVNVLRDDDPLPSFPVESILANAPLRDGDFFRVRGVLDE